MIEEKSQIIFSNESSEIKRLTQLSLGVLSSCVIRGQDVQPDLAEEICVRTSSFHQLCTSSQKLKQRLYTAFGLSTTTPSNRHLEALQKEYNVLPLRYLRNNCWCSNNIIPSIWITWEGAIGFDGNLCPFMTAMDIYKEWVLIAMTFPELSLQCQLYACDMFQIPTRTPVLQFILSNGKVDIQMENIQIIPSNVFDTHSFAIHLNPDTGDCKCDLPQVPNVLQRVKQSLYNKHKKSQTEMSSSSILQC